MGQREKGKKRKTKNFLRGFLGKGNAREVDAGEVHSKVQSFVKRPIAEVIEERMVLLPTSNPMKMTGLCPFHNDHNPSLQVSLDKEKFICWACGAHGDAIDFVREYDKVSWHEALTAACSEIVYEKDDGNEPGANIGGALRSRLAGSVTPQSSKEDVMEAVKEARRIHSRAGIDSALKYWDNRLFNEQ